jgi:hypothetical protein
VKALHIFKPGKHTAVNGKVIEFTEAMVAAIAKGYDTTKHEAPIVVGHPKADDAPAYGWARTLSFSDGVLIAMPDQVDTAFAEMVNAGRFKKISASFYEPDSSSNPTPGQYYLRHIGFLGAQPPAVKGLKSASFADAEQGVVEFAEVTPWTMESLKTLMRNIREWIISKGSIDEADSVMPAYLIDTIQAAPEANAIAAAYTEHQPENDMLTKEQEAAAAKLKADQEDLARREAEFAEREARIKATEEVSRRAEIAAFVGNLVTAGQLLPRDQAGLVAYMSGPNEAGVIEFGEGDDKKSAQPTEWLRTFLQGLPKQVDFKERTPADDKPAVDINDPKAIAEKAVAFQESEAAAGRTVTASAAVEYVMTAQGKQ